MFSSTRKHLRHPIRAIREPFGTAGLIVAMIALVAALGGTALAAAKLNSTQKKEVEKIAKKFQGTGPAGAAGANGTNGTNGAPGAPGANGTSVTSTTLPEGDANCAKGGSKFVSASGETFACNGAKGTNGTAGKSVVTGVPTTGECSEGGATVEVTGEPLTKQKVCNGFGSAGTLPSGKTETGAWSFSGLAPEEVILDTAVSLPIPLSTGIASSNAEFLNVARTATTPGVCKGTVKNPTAPAGHICVYTQQEEHTVPFERVEVVNVGRIAVTEFFLNGFAIEILTGEGAEPQFARIFGTWAVTAP